MRTSHDIMLIGTNFDSQCYEATNIPLGLAWIGAVLKQEGFSTIGHDLQLAGRDLQRLKERIEEVDPKIIGVQFHAMVTFDFTLQVVIFIKQRFPDIVLLAGGLQATMNPGPILEQGKIDYIVQGEGELVTLELVRALLGRPAGQQPEEIRGLLFKQGDRIINTGRAERIADLDALPLPAREIFEWQRYPQWVIMTARGCPYQCAFCSSHAYWGEKTVFRSATSIVREIDQLVGTYGVRSFLFNDDTFTLKRSRVVSLCHDLIARDYGLSWACGTRADHLDRELLALMQRAGCVEVSFGLETANQKTLDYIKKGITTEQQRRAVSACKELGIQCRVSVMLGLPGESLTDNRKTLRFLQSCEPNEVQIYPLMPYLGTELRDHLDEFGINILSDQTSAWTKNSLEPIAETTQITQADIAKMAEEMVVTLVGQGYTHLTPFGKNTKQKLGKVVSTGLTAFQLVESYQPQEASS